MKVRCLVWVTLAGILVGCASDGGPTGTGISTSISGNVAEVELADEADGATVDSVRVSLDEVPGIEDVTNADGEFEIVGMFSGRLTLRFAKLDVSAAQPLDVPAGSSIELRDVAFGQNRVRVGTARQLGFFGTVAFTDCESGDLLVDDRASSHTQFLVRLLSNSIIVTGQGDLVSCAVLEEGKEVAIEGGIRLGDGSIEAVTVTVDPPGPGEPSPVVETSFAGTITLVNCESAMVSIEGNAGPARLRLSEESDLLDHRGQPIECADLEADDLVEGSGLIRVRRPEVIDVLELRVGPQGGS